MGKPHNSAFLLGVFAAGFLYSQHAAAFGLWAGRYPVPLQQYLNRPFEPEDVCVQTENGSLIALDLHLLGRPKALDNSFQSYSDDGALELETHTVTHFSEGGQIVDSIETDQAHETISKTVFRYDAQGELSEVTSELPKRQLSCVAHFAYDKVGHLVRISSSSADGDDRIVDIAYERDGRPKEAIQRLSTGKGEWRLLYSYQNHRVKIDRYSNDAFGDTHDQTEFEINADGRPSKAIASSHSSQFGDETGTFVYKYLPSGISLLHLETSRNSKSCIYDFSLHRNGEVDLKSVSVLGEPALWCGPPPTSGETLQIYFDGKGNKIVDKEGHQIEELGKAVLRWQYVILNSISYSHR